ncbi:MAG: UDP-N-acetylmuramoyl-tripeptide--D-alanyl-D-alanine ligase [Fimbriimonas sp.]
MSHSLLDLARRLKADPQVPGDAAVTGFATDSNSVKEGDLFLAFKGTRVDGHAFARQAREQGAVAALVERPVDAPYLLVPDVIEALAEMARSFRTTFGGPVVGVTGSAGKTTTKEFVAAALSPLGPVLKSAGNRNSEYTSPLVWTELEPAHSAAVIEMAMRGFGQIRHLASFSLPTVGIVTNIGYSHLEYVESREGIANAKGELLEALPEGGLGIVWHEDEYVDILRPKASRVCSFGFSAEADCRITRYDVIDWTSCAVSGEVDGQAWEARLPAVGRHIALDAAAAVLAAWACGVHPAAAGAALSLATLPPMRMEVVERNGASILLDTYNAAPPSVLAAIQTLAEMPVTGRRRAVIGEMRELGEHREEAHRSVGRMLVEQGIQEAIFLGEPTVFAREAALEAGASDVAFLQAKSIEDVREFLNRSEPGDAVLVKGSRALELERALE